MHKKIQLACYAFIAVQIFLSLSFLVAHIGDPWPSDILIIDGLSYIRGAHQFVLHKSIFFLPDQYHSPGYQAYLGLLLWWGGSTSSLVLVGKIISFIFYLLSIFFVIRLGERFFSKSTGILAAVILSASISWRYYINMIQYELVVGFILLWVIAQLTNLREMKQSMFFFRTTFAGLLLTVLSIFHWKFSPLLLLPYFFKKKLSSTKQYLYFLCVFSPFFIWIFFQSMYLNTTSLFRGIAENQFRFSNHLNSTGEYSTIRQKILEPSGWDFVFSHPANFFDLVVQRFLFLWGIKLDIWALPPSDFGRSGWESSIALLGLFIFALGLFFAMRGSKDGVKISRVALYFSLAVFILPPLFFIASQRYLVPVIPIIAMFQAYGVIIFGQFFLNKYIPKKYFDLY